MHRVIPPLFCLLTFACQSYPLQSVPNMATTALNAHFATATQTDTDILFVIDNSGSMRLKQDRLIKNAQDFVQQIVGSGKVLRLGIISTDRASTSERGQLRPMPAGGLWLDTPSLQDPQADSKRQAVVDGFVATVRGLGTNGDSRESGFYNALSAVGQAQPQDANVIAHNAGFLRDGADLAVIFLTDEDDCSQTAADMAARGGIYGTAEDCYEPSLESGRLTAAAVITGLAAARGGDVTRLRAGAIIAGTDNTVHGFTPVSCLNRGVGQAVTAQCGCWAPSSNGATNPSLQAIAQRYCAFNAANDPTQQSCSRAPEGNSCAPETSCLTPHNGCEAQCEAMGGYRYNNFITALSAQRLAAGTDAGTVAASVCEDSFAIALNDIAVEVVAPRCFQLPAANVAGTNILVTVQGRAADKSLKSKQTLPWLSQDPAAACHSCGDCATGAWSLTGPRSLCLTCGLTLAPGDEVDVQQLAP